MDTPRLESIGIGQLIARIDRKWDTREPLRASLAQRVPALRSRARLPNAALMQLLDADQRAVA
jgi:hypothetical protein